MANISFKPNIFEFTEYKLYISTWIASQPSGGRGIKSKIASASGCHLAYVSQVLAGNAHFSLEQAESLNALLEHADEEAQFFLLLISKCRAGTLGLRKHFEKEIQKILNARLVLKNRFNEVRSLNEENQAVYYSHWAYCATHMALLNSELRTPTAISKYFDMPLNKVIEILNFLTSVGLAKKEKGALLPGEARIHLGSDSPMIAKHHTNWRIQAIRSLERESTQELHYSGVISVGLSDLPKIRELLVACLEQIRSVVKESKNETVYCYNLDLFGLSRD